MKIGNVHYSDRLKSLTWTNFKRFWKRKGQSDISVENAAKNFGINVPEKYR